VQKCKSLYGFLRGKIVYLFSFFNEETISLVSYTLYNSKQVDKRTSKQKHENALSVEELLPASYLAVRNDALRASQFAMMTLIESLCASAYFQLIHLFTINSIRSEEQPLMKKTGDNYSRKSISVVRYRKEVHL
jgi:hypothetical protein